MTEHATLDVESYSEAGFYWHEGKQAWVGPKGAPASKKGLPVVGAYVYWEHPTAEVLMLSYRLPRGNSGRWRPGEPPPAPLLDYLAAGGPIEFHNAQFEKLGWWHCLHKKHGWPPLDPNQVLCSMATAHVNGYPGALGDLGPALGTDARKDPLGKALMDVFSKPRKPTKADARRRVHGHDATPIRFQGALRDPRELFDLYHDYCDADVATEADASARMEPMTPAEREAWLLDQRMNWTGIAIDRAGVRDCIAILEQALERYGRECEAITGGLGPSQVQALLGWITAQQGAWRADGGRFVNAYFGSLAADELEAYLAIPDLPRDVRRVLEIRALVGSAGVKKLYAMENRTSCDDRLRGLFVHHGTRTGRPTGEGVQSTNLVKIGPKLAWARCCNRPVRPLAPWCPWCGAFDPAPDGKGRWAVEMVEHVLEIMACRSLDMVETYFGDAVLCIQGCIRPMLVAGPGMELLSSDYSAIEAVVAACISGEQWRIDTFKRKEDIYLASASKITGTPVSVYLDYSRENGSHHPDRQYVGKVAELALGFGGWVGSWRNFDPDSDSKTDEQIIPIIVNWRGASPRIVDMWGGQRRKWQGIWVDERFGIEGAFINAVENPGCEFWAGPLSFRMTAPFGRYDRLKLRLPSGRELTYHEPMLTPSQRRPGTLSISYMTDNSNPKYGALGWVRMETWGSRVFENAVQAIAHCMMRGARKRLFARGYPLVQEVYDEAVSEVPAGFGSIEEFEAIMGEGEDWAVLPNGERWPIRASGGWRGKRYRKD